MGEITTTPQINPPLPTDRPGEVIFQLGTIQAFWFPTEEEIVMNTMYHDVYWRDLRYTHHFGPFPSVYNAMSHYAYLAKAQRDGYADMKTNDLTPDKPVASVIPVDFRIKKRVIYDIPGEETSNVPSRG